MDERYFILEARHKSRAVQGFNKAFTVVKYKQPTLASKDGENF